MDLIGQQPVRSMNTLARRMTQPDRERFQQRFEERQQRRAVPKAHKTEVHKVELYKIHQDSFKQGGSLQNIETMLKFSVSGIILESIRSMKVIPSSFDQNIPTEEWNQRLAGRTRSCVLSSFYLELLQGGFESLGGT